MTLSTASTCYLFVIGRFIAGIGIGYGAVIGPLYIAEIASTESRGQVGCITQGMCNTFVDTTT
jgi:MFS family permease